MSMVVSESQLEVIDQKQITGLTTAKELGPIPAKTEFALLQAVGANVRVNYKRGVNPTAAVGYLLLDGTPGKMEYTNLNDITVIEQAATATLEVVFLKNKGTV